MFRLKDRFHLKRDIGPYYISTVSLLYKSFYEGLREYSDKFMFYTFGMFSKEYKNAIGWYETIVFKDFDNENLQFDILEQKRYNSLYRARRGHKEMIEKYENLYNNSKGGLGETPGKE